MSGFFSKIKDMFGMGIDESEYDVDYNNMIEYEEEIPQPKNNNVTPFNSYSRSNYQRREPDSINVSASINMEVCMFNPQSLEDAADACSEIKDNKIVLVNLENVEHDTSQRISDFLCGASYALEGNIQLISDKIMIITPINVEMSGELKDKLQQSGIKIPGSIWR